MLDLLFYVLDGEELGVVLKNELEEIELLEATEVLDRIFNGKIEDINYNEKKDEFALNLNGNAVIIAVL